MSAAHYTVSQFRERFPMGSSTFYRIVGRGEIRITKLGAATRIAVDEAERWAASLPQIGGQANA